jgi:deoxyribodipyrimidine photo-lyase
VDDELILENAYHWLNFLLDRIDPNGYVWSIVSAYDRAWTERHVFGKICLMNRNGATRKFDV